jgi:hypothetical protein
MPRCRAIASCRFFVVELYAVWRLPAPAVAISEIVTASASMTTGKLRYLVMVRLEPSAAPIPTGILARPLRELMEMPTDDPECR